jgi:L-ascorbate metabolism protein UlaG (beta-lactamase superfamily)
MKKLFRVLKITATALLSVVLLVIIATIAFVNMSPQFGNVPADEHQEKFARLSNYQDGKFQNQVPTHVGLTFRQTLSVTRKFFFDKGNGKTPEAPLPMERLDSAIMSDRAEDIARLTWFGHSAILLEIDGKKILMDPMLGQHAGPLPLISPRRYNKELPLEIEQLPFVDVVVISHDHYDHLDYGSIRKLKDKVGRFYVPLGVGDHLKSWGVKSSAITELNWWEESQFGGFTFVCAPARHFSGRAFKSNTTLWCSWVIRSSSRQFYFSGDSGYGPHFKEIGDRYGTMDFVMMECGQYNELWTAIHMMPEETVQATLDVKGKLLLPIHWGAFTLAMHPWTDPVDRVTAEASRRNLPVATPKIGEVIHLNGGEIPDARWW